jgi:tRNA modification GTPase
MYELNDTIVAVSSPSSQEGVIVRISGPETVGVLRRIFSPMVSEAKAGLISGSIAIDSELRIDAKLYLFLAPHSYTGDDIAEIHIYTNASVTKALMASLLSKGLRPAGPGEFTARSFLNGKIDLAQAEAVNEVVVSSNKFQLAAAEKLLAGRLAETTERLRSSIMDCLSLIEAGLDFSGEDIEFIAREQLVERLDKIKSQLERLLSGSISYETVLDLPAVGIAGAPNAGKSSLGNKLLGRARSIVSAERKTTRDVLNGELALRGCECVLFDCAGLMEKPEVILDELAQQAAIESLQKALVVVFCVDVSKPDWNEDIAIRGLIQQEILVPVATKADLLPAGVLADRLGELSGLFGADFLATSTETGAGIEQLKEIIDTRIIELTTGGAGRVTKFEVPDTKHGIALTSRHRQAVGDAIRDIVESVNECKAGNDEVAAMMLRACYQGLSAIQTQHIDEQILERIFSRFCIGK